MTVAVKREVVDAFRSVGIDEEKAWQAAEALSGTDEQFAKLDAKIDQAVARLDAKIEQTAARIDGKIDRVEAGVRGELNLHRWMLGTMIAMTVAVLVKLFTI